MTIYRQTRHRQAGAAAATATFTAGGITSSFYPFRGANARRPTR